jgi:type IV secretion system protein VirB8
MTQFPGDKLPGQRSSPSPERNANYAGAATWAADIHGALRASRRVAWIIAGAAVVVALLEALALAALTPLKTVVPYTILVDRQTGYVQTVQGLKPGPLTENQAVTQSFLVQYVIARETFDAADLVDNYRKVMLWSADNARSAYRQDMAKTNPNSPLVVNTPTTIVQTTIKSVSLLTPGTALVRFETMRRDGGAATGEVRAYAAVLAFRYTVAPMRMEDRFTNPLGFQVLSYRRDAETVPGVAVRTAGTTAP